MPCSQTAFQVQVCEALLADHPEGVICRVCQGTGAGGASVAHKDSCAFAKLLLLWSKSPEPSVSLSDAWEQGFKTGRREVLDQFLSRAPDANPYET